MNTIRHFIAFSAVVVLGMLLGERVQGQSYTMVNGQTVNIDARQQRTGIIYDDGGATSNYSNSFNGYVVIDAGPYLTLTLNGSYSTESCCDKINIWDGDNLTGTLVANDLSGSGNVNITSRSGRITIQFHTDGSVISSGFAFEYSASGIDCDESACSNTTSGLTVSNITPTSAELSWQSSGSGPYYVSVGDESPVTVTGTTHSLTGLNSNTVYTAKVTSETTPAFCCYSAAQFHTACGTMSAPQAERFDDYGTGAAAFPTCWGRQCNFDGIDPAYVSGDAYSSFPASLRVTTTVAGYWSVITGPAISSPSISSLHLRVKLRAPYAGTSVEVGICNDTTFYGVSSTFTPIDTLTVNTANQWIEFVVPFDTYTGTGQYLAFRMDRSLQGGNNRIIYIDDLFVEGCGVWNMGLFKRNAHNLWVQWNTYGSPTLTVEYGPAGFLPGTGTTVADPVSPLHITGLEASTAYEVRLYPACASTIAAESYQSIVLTTLEGPYNDLNICEDFEVGDLPTGWRRHNLYDGTPQTSSNYHHSGSRSLRMRPDYTTTMPTVVLPMIDTVEIGNLNVSFWLYSDGYTTGRVVVGVTEYPEVSSDFVPVDTILLDVSNAWRRYQVSLAGYRGDGRYLALHAFDPNTHYNNMYIDDLEVGTCLVSGAYVTNIGSHSVQIRWDTVGTTFLGDSVMVEYGGTGFGEGTGTRVAVAVRGNDVQTVGGKQYITLTGLEADSSYTFLLYGQCDTMVQACGKTNLTAHTLEQNPTLPYCVDFEGMADGSYPSEWYRPSMYDNFPRIYDNGSPKHSGNRAIYLRSYRELENHSTIVLPLLETDSVNGLTVSFYTWGESSDGQTVQIGVMDDPSDESTFTVVGTTTAPYNKWSSRVIPINGYTGTGRYLALRFYNNYFWSSNGLWIDDIEVSDAAAMDRTVGSITSHGATFSWHGAGRAYNGAYVEWDTAGFIRGTGHKDTVDANTFSLTIDTLLPGTTYDFFITAVSREREVSCNYTRSSFTTFSQPTAASYCYGFEDVANDGFPVGWTQAAVYNNSPKVGSEPHTGNRAMYLRCIWHDNTRYNSFATMPYLEEATLDGLNLKFYAKGQGYYGNLVVGMMTSPSDTSTFVPLDTFNIQDNSHWQEKNVDLGRYTGSGRHIAFKHQSSGTCSWCKDWVWIDDITINRCRVSRVRSYSETSTTVKIEWAPSGAMDSVEVEYGPQGFAPGSGISVTTTDTVVSLSNLEEGSAYDFYVRPYCTNSSQICSESKYSFSTTQQRVGDNWCEDLESHDGNYSMPYHWSRPAMWSEWPKIWTHSDGQRYTAFPSVLEFRADYDGVNIAVLPASEDPLSQLVLSLDMRLHPDYSNPNRCTLIVGAMPDPFDTAAFTPIDTLHPDFFYHRFDVDLASYSGPYRHLALKYPSSGGRTMLVDALRLSRCRPSQARILAVADNSITLAWQRLGYNDTTRIVYGVEGEDFADGTLVNVLGTDTTFSQLYPDTVYWFYLFGGCADSLIQCQGVHIRQKTLSEPMTVPVCFKFEDSPLSVGLPNGWVRPYGNTEACISGSSNYNHTWQGSRALHLYAYSCDNIDYDRTNMVAMPTLQATSLSGLWLEFYSMFTDSRMKVIVGIMTDPNDSDTFIPLDTIAGSSGWLRHTIDLSSYSGSGRNIAFKSFAPVCSSGDIYIDDISIRPCIVTAALAGMPTNHSLVLSYTTSSGATGAWVEYRRVGGAGQDFAPGTGDTVHITSSTYTFTGLDEATWYAFHVYPDCGNGSDGCSYVVTIAQTLHPGVDIPYCESFDLYSSGNYPNNWRRHTSYSDDRPYIYSGANHSSDNAMYFQVDGEGFAMAVMPRLNVGPTCPVVDSLYANFWLYSDYNWNAAALIVGIVTDANNPDSFIPIDTLRPTDYAIWEHHTVAIRNFSSTDTYVAYKFVSTDNSYANIRMDDLCMEKCVAADVTVSNITQNNVTVSWISYGVDSLVCEYGPRGFAAGSGTTVVLHGSPAVISGLLDGTDYQFTFASVCGCQQYGATYSPGGGSYGGSGGGGGCHYCGWCWGWTWHQAISPSDSNYWYWCWGPWHGHPWNWSPSGTTTYYPPVVDTVTTQASFLHIPYCESFEDYDTVSWPHSWRRIGGQTPGFPSLTQSNHHFGQTCLDFYASPGSSNYAALAPLEPGTTSSLVLTFFAYANNYYATTSSARFIVGVMDDPDVPSSFSPIDTVRLSATGLWEQHVVDLAPYAGSGQYVAFRFAPVDASYHYYVDDIYLGSCAISNASTTTTPSAVTLSWQSHHTPTAVNVEYGPQGFSPGSDQSLGTLFLSSSPANLSSYGILPDDNYDLYVTAVCNDTALGCFTSPITLNPRLYLPYCEDFEDLPIPDWPESVYPSRWKVVQRNNNRPQYPRSEVQYQQNVISFYPGTGDRSNTVLLPPLPDNDTLEGKWVYAYFSTSNNNYIFLDFGYLADTNNPSSFVQMASLSNGASDQLREFNIQLTAPAPIGNRFAFRARSTSGERWLRLSRLVVSGYPYPTSIASTPLGVATRRITWSGEYNNPYYSIQYGYADQWQTITLSDSCSATLTGLRPGRDYQVYFISPNGERLCLPYRFTNEEYLSLPYCDDFESYSQYSVPNSWIRAVSWTSSYSYPRVENNVHYSSPYRSLQFYNGCSSDRWNQLSLPDIDIDSLRHLSLSFRMRFDYSTNNIMIVGIQTSQSDPSSFIPVDTILGTSSWQTYSVSLAPYSGTGRYVTFRHLQTNGSCHYAYIDDLTLSSCPLPSFSVAGARQVCASLPHGGTPDYYIEYDTAGFTPGTGTLIHVTSDPFLITGLSPNTSYHFYARCLSQETPCAAPATVTTSQELSLPLCEDFDSYSDVQAVPHWYSHSTHSDNPSYPRTYYSAYNSCCRTLDFYCNRDNLQYIALPDLDVDSLRHLELYFNLRIEQTNYTSLVVGIMDDPDDFSSFYPIDTVTCDANGTYYAKHVSLSNYTGTGRFVAFRILTSYSSRTSIFIDDLSILPYPNPRITLSSANTVRILRADQRDFWIEMAPHDTVQSSSSNRWFHITRDTFDITGLDYLTSYDFYHHADSGTVSCFPKKSITTSSILPVPHCDDFSFYPPNSMPDAWLAYRMGNTPEPYVNSNHELFFGNYCNPNNRDYAILPQLDIDSIRNLDLYFDLYSSYSTTEHLVVGVMDDRNDIGTFTPVDTVRCSRSGQWEAKHVSLASYQGQGRFLAFCAWRTTSCLYLYLDNLYIQSCPRPSIQLVGATTIASIVPSDRSADYWLEYGPQGITPGSVDTLYNTDSSSFSLVPHNTLLHVTSDTLLLTDLLSNTTYDFYARCDSATSSCYTLSATITTSHLQSLPYCEDFDSYGTGSSAFPTGWRRLTSDNNNDRLYVYNDSDAPDRRSLRFQTYSGSYAYAILPEINAPHVSDLSVGVRMWSQCSVTPSQLFLEVGVMDNMDDISTFTTVDTLQTSTACQWEELSASLATYSGNGRFIAFRMHETQGYTRNIYLDRIEVRSCDIPSGIRAVLHSHNQVRIDADHQSHTGFWVEYGTLGFLQGSGTLVRVDTLPFILTLDNNTSYDFYFRCDTNTLSCITAKTVTTLSAPLSLPLCIDFESCDNNTLFLDWKRLRHPQESSNDCYVYSNEHHSGGKSLRFYSYYADRHPYAVLPFIQVDSLSRLAVSFWMKTTYNPSSFILELGVMSNPDDPSTFLSIKQFSNTQDDSWQRMQAVLSGAPADARFIAFRLTKTNNYSSDWLYIDDIYFDTCGAAEWHITAIESDHVTFEWNQTGSPDVTLEYGPVGFTPGNGTIVNMSTLPPFTLTGLDNLTNYHFNFNASCSSSGGFCSTDYSNSTTVFTPSGGTGCIDPTNLTADYTTCFYGTFGNPYQNTGFIDYGSESTLSRHTVHYDTTETDPRTEGLLHTVPTGARASVRLGNWGSSSEAEAISYSLFVDSTQFDLLILKYAAVLQDRLHPSSSQPRFKIEILDEDGNLIDPNCGAADFIANQNLGWNLVQESFVLWKDWTTVGIDMSAYYGRTVQIRLTTFDCGDGQHYGYAYFTLNCLQKTMISERCGDVDSNRFSAPSGFAYSWYTNLDTTIFSNEQSIVVPTNNDITYYCKCAFVDKADCYFTLSAFAGTRYPLAQMEYSQRVENCHIYVDFRNTSTISSDGINPIGSGEPCEAAWWDFGNGDTADTYNAQALYTSPGTYTVTLVSSIASRACTDTAVYLIDLAMNTVSPAITGPANACMGDTLTLRVDHALEHSWSTGQTDSIISVLALGEGAWTCTVVDSNGCPDTLRHTVSIHPTYDTTILATICNGTLYAWDDTVLSTPGTWRTHHQTLNHFCDSIATLHLTVGLHSDTTLFDTVPESLLPYTFLGTTFTGPADSVVFTTANAAGCDSTIVYWLEVSYAPKWTRLDSTVCETALPVLWLSDTLQAAGSDSITFQGAHGEDSTVVLVLTVVPTVYTTLSDTVVENNLPYAFADTLLTASGSWQQTLAAASGCDSVVSLLLTVFPNVDTTLYDTVCESALPYWWGGILFAEAGLFRDTLVDAYGADSVVTMVLTVVPTTYGSVAETVFENDLPHSFGELTFDADTSGVTITTTNAAGCDSIITYSLTVFWNNSTVVDTTVCADALPLTWHGHLFHSAGTRLDTLQTSQGADSLVRLALFVNPVYSDTLPASICQGETYPFEDTSYTMAGLYTHSLLTEAGCDSLRTLVLTVNAASSATVSATVCDSLQWYDSLYTVSTENATYVTTNAVGCDSTTTLHLTVLHSSAATVYDSITENELPYSFNGVTFSDSVSHATVSLANAAGCDSLIDYSLYVFWNTGVTLDSALCNDRLPIVWNGVVFDTAVTQTTRLTRSATLTAQTGADSVVVMRLTVYPLYDKHLYVDLCDNQSTTFGTHTFAGSDGDTVCLDSLLSSQGCDSLSTLHLTVHPTYDLHHYDTLCTSQGYSWGAPLQQVLAPFFHNAAATPSDTTINRGLSTATFSCDSVQTLHLHLLPSYDLHLYDTLCSEEWSAANGQWLPHTYTFEDTTLFNDEHGMMNDEGAAAPMFIIHHSSLNVNNSGCDSLRTLHLTVNPVYDIHIYDTIFDGDRYPFCGSYYDTTTTVNCLLSTVTFSCDSLRTLHLQRNPRTPSDTVVCRNRLPIVWNGITFAGEGTDSVRLVGRGGIDSLVVMRVRVLDTASTVETLQACDSLRWQDDSIYSQSTDLPRLLFATSQGCDSVVHLDLTIGATRYMVDRQVACDSLLWTDGRWYLSDTTATVGPLGSQVATGPVDTLLTADGCDSVVSLDLTLHPSYYSLSTDTICYNQSYSWHDLALTPSADVHTTTEHLLTDTMATVWSCDSVLAMHVTQLARPRLTVGYDYDCRQNRYYLTAQATLDWGTAEGEEAYITWNAYPYDSLLVPGEAEATASPHADPTLYYVFADYREVPTCPVGDSLRLRPLVVPTAMLQVNPEAMSIKAHEFDAYDITHPQPYSVSPDSTQQWERTWYLDWRELSESSSHIHYDVPLADVDSVVVALEVFNGQCYDTAIHVVPMLRADVLAPNVFTPSQETNNRFTIIAQGFIEAELFIYNREGLLVYRTHDLDQGWDGRNASGTPCPQGSYVWKLVYKAADWPASQRTQVGSVLLLR